MRGRLADRVAWNPGARTEQISLADEASYSLAGKRQDGASEVLSRANMPFVGRFRLELSDLGMGQLDQCFAEFDIKMPRTVSISSSSRTTTVLTLTVAAGHEVHKGQWIVIRGAGTDIKAASQGVALQVASITATTILITVTDDGASGGSTATAVIKFQPMAISQVDWVMIYDDVTAEDQDIVIGAPQAGQYRVSAFHDTSKTSFSALFYSDGVAIEIQTYDLASPAASQIPVDFRATNTEQMICLFISSSELILANNDDSNVDTRITVEYKAAIWSVTDADEFVCFFEKNGDLILRNRLGATKIFAIENIGTSRPNRVASPDPNPRITELKGPIT